MATKAEVPQPSARTRSPRAASSRSASSTWSRDLAQTDGWLVISRSVTFMMA